MSVGNRLAQLESRFKPSTAKQAAKELHLLLDRAAPFYAGWVVLSQTMDAEHEARVDADLLGSFVWGRMNERSPLHLAFLPGLYSDDPLVKRVCTIIRDGVSGRHAGPFAFPLAVSRIFAEENISPQDDCSGCGYHLPRPHFRESGCPLCGAWVECNAYYRTHYRQPERYAFPGDVIVAMREHLAPQIARLLELGPGEDERD